MKQINVLLTSKKLYIAKLGILTFLVLLSSNINAQLTARPTMYFKGQYDIKMISSTALQPAWISSQNPFVVHSMMTDDQMAHTKRELSMNNDLANSENAVASSTLAGVTAVKPAGTIGYTMVYTDCDTSMSTFQSSAAYLDFGADFACTTVQAAYLYWATSSGGTTNYAAYPGTPTMRSHAGGATGSTSGTSYKTVKFKAPGDVNYTDVTASRELGSDRLVCFADVTNLVKGKSGGLYWVANLRAPSVSQVVAGWSLVVIFTPPNCPPRTIKFWDGMQEIDSGNNQVFDFTFNPGEVPASGNSKSYLGVAVLDGENIASYLIPNNMTPEFLEFQSLPGGSVFKINPFATGQTSPYPGEPLPGYAVYSDAGALLSSNAEDGFSCSRITSWDETKGTNGNELIRLPSVRNTVGYDAHHLKLPVGSMVPGATSAKMTYYAGPQGGTSPFMAYMAIETLQPNLKLFKTSIAETTQAGSEITYKLKVTNIGPLASKPTTYILDTLDLPVDFVPGSVTYVRGVAPKPFEIKNQGADVNENLKFYIPSIAAGIGEVAQDSVIITFKVKVQPITRMDIWSVGCRRTVKNKATMHYQADDDSELLAGSNSSAGCGGAGQYAEVKVDDTILENLYQTTHKLDTTLTNEVNTAITAGNPLKIDAQIRKLLELQLTKLTHPTSEAALYTIFDSEGAIVSPTAPMLQDNPVQTYVAYRDLGYECEEIFTFTITVAKVPKIFSVTPELTSNVGAKDGKVTIHVKDGEPGYSCKIVDPSDENIVYYEAYTAAPTSELDFKVDGLAAGSYKIIIGDQGTKTATTPLTITDSPALTVSISGLNQVCKGSEVTLSAIPAGRPANTYLDYVWYIEGNSTPIGFDKTIRVVNNALTNYKVYVCDKGVDASDTHQVDALTTPVVQVLASDSGCYQFNLANLDVSERNNMASSDYVLTLHNQQPSSATDNRYLIAPNKYSIKKTQNVWARMSVNDLCYSTAMGQAFVKSMEQCHPIVIQDFFSPDGDGLNDRWLVGGLEEYTNPEIIVYDRYGKVVFKGGKEDVLPPNGWDGTYLGNPLPSADYWYQMNFLEIETKVGHFTLKRRKE